MNIKKATNSQLLTDELKKIQTVIQTKQPEQEQNLRYADYLEGYQLWGGRGSVGEKVQELKSIIGRYKIDRGMLRFI